MRKNKLLFSLFLFILIYGVNAGHAQTRWGVKAGVNFSKLIIENESGSKQPTQFVPRFQAGLTAEIPIAADLYIQPAALYSGKGFRQENNWFSGSDNEFKTTVSYIEVPLNFLYKPPLGKGNLLIGAGPYVAYGAGGTWEAESNVIIGDIVIDDYGDVIFKDDRVNGEFGAYLYGKPFDYGATFLAGYEFMDTFSVQINAQLGLANLQPAVDGEKPEGKRKNAGFGVSVGYKF